MERASPFGWERRRVGVGGSTDAGDRGRVLTVRGSESAAGGEMEAGGGVEAAADVVK